MTEKVKIPKILQEREGPSRLDEFSQQTKEKRKEMSAKMARILVGITFDEGKWLNINEDATDQDKINQDAAFATYEENLRESHYQEVRYRARRLGSLVMTMPGIHTLGDTVTDTKLTKRRRKQRRTDWKARNGTVKSNMRKRYIAHTEKYPT